MFRPSKGAPGSELWDSYTGCESRDPADGGDVECLSEALVNSFDLVVANILARSLVELHDTLEMYCRRGGSLVLSGVLEE